MGVQGGSGEHPFGEVAQGEDGEPLYRLGEGVGGVGGEEPHAEEDRHQVGQPLVVDIEALDTALAEQTDMTELVGDDGREHSRLPGLAEVELDHGVTINLVVPADRPVPAAAAPQGVGCLVGAVEVPHTYVTGVDPHHHADPPDQLLDLGRGAGEVRREEARGRERRLTLHGLGPELLYAPGHPSLDPLPVLGRHRAPVELVGADPGLHVRGRHGPLRGAAAPAAPDPCPSGWCPAHPWCPRPQVAATAPILGARRVLGRAM